MDPLLSCKGVQWYQGMVGVSQIDMAAYRFLASSGARFYPILSHYDLSSYPSTDIVQRLNDLSSRPKQRVLVETIALRGHVVKGMVQSPRYQTLSLDLIVMA